MSLAQALNAKKADPELILEMARGVASKIHTVCALCRVILFGSAAEGEFRSGSDLDFLLIFPDGDSMQTGRKQIRALGKLHDQVPVDLIFVSREHFESKKNLGGVCFIAEHDGIEL